jgi:hypothetical protein
MNVSNQVTNKHGLPQVFVNLANRDKYSRGDARISVTELINSPKIRVLRKLHQHEIIEDVVDRVWSMFGTAVHNMVQEGADENHIAEERLFIEVNGWRLSGGIDLQIVLSDGSSNNRKSATITDYKVTTAWSVMNNKVDWERQLNCYAHLAETAKGWDITGLQIVAIVRDWSRREAARNPEYPQTPIVRVPQSLWSSEERTAYIEAQVRHHQDAERASDWQEDLPTCTDEERWYRPGKLAVMKDGRVRALKLFETHERREAELFAKENKGKVIERSGENVRCDSFCSVSEWCSQYSKTKGETDE